MKPKVLWPVLASLILTQAAYPLMQAAEKMKLETIRRIGTVHD
jgi:hypothetical protein